MKQKRHLRAAQRSILRRMVWPGRKPDEECIPWIKRSTKLAEERARDAGTDCWLKQQMRLKWNWAGTIANMTDERRAKRVTFWRDSKWQSENGTSTLRPLRDRPGNRMRWEDEMRKYTAHAGINFCASAAMNNVCWESNKDTFVEWAWR